jgi:phage tail-like protein
VTDSAPAAPSAVSDGHDPPAAGEELPHGDAESVPEVASAREYLRSGLPSIYREKDSFGMRFLYGLERVLDRHVAIIDSLGAYLSPQLAPPEMVDAIAGWLGLALDDAPTEAVFGELLSIAERHASIADASRELPGGVELHTSAEEVRRELLGGVELHTSAEEVRRELLGGVELHTSAEEVRRKLLGSAEQIARLRGTRAGLELVFEICFPELHLKVEDHGAVLLLNGAVEPPDEPYPGFEVHCQARLEPALRGAVERAIERQRPLQVARQPVKDASELVADASELIEDAALGPER